jgi:phenylacetate-CoA ligase
VPAEVFPKRQVIARQQVEQLRALLNAIIPANPFYTAKFAVAGAPTKVMHLGDFSNHFPFTTKAELVADQAAHPSYGTNLTFPIICYTRCHQTSGTTAQPLLWLDTPESWNWMLGNWQAVWQVAGVTAADRIFFAFSFGPFLGFWTAFEAAVRLGAFCLPAGGMSSVARLRAILDHGITVLCCTPTYALHLAEMASREGIDLRTSRVRLIVVAGEAGGSIPAVRGRITELWPGARPVDHHGMTEVGPVTFECPARPGTLHVIESSYIAEVVNPQTGATVAGRETGELILTTLGRTGSPLLRYRTGDLVRPAADAVCPCGRSDLALEGGILGRVDEMVVVRGVNVYPGAVEEIVRRTGGVAEYRVEVNRSETLAEIGIEIEPYPEITEPSSLARSIADALQTALNLRVPVKIVPAGSLPRFELKAKRWVQREVAVRVISDNAAAR